MDHIDKIVNFSRETKLLRVASIVMIEVTMQMLEQATKTNLSPGTRWRRSEDRKVGEIPVTWRNTSQQFVFILHRTPSWAYNQNQTRGVSALVLVAIWSMKRSTAPVPHSAPSIALFVTSLELEDTEITLLSPNNCQLQLWSSQVGALHEQSSLSLRICFNLLRVLT